MKIFFVLLLALLASFLAGCNAATPDLSAHATQVAFIVYATETAMAPIPMATQPQPTATCHTNSNKYSDSDCYTNSNNYSDSDCCTNSNKYFDSNCYTNTGSSNYADVYAGRFYQSPN